jgi:hypothetical protein
LKVYCGWWGYDMMVGMDLDARMVLGPLSFPTYAVGLSQFIAFDFTKDGYDMEGS